MKNSRIGIKELDVKWTKILEKLEEDTLIDKIKWKRKRYIESMVLFSPSSFFYRTEDNSFEFSLYPPDNKFYGKCVCVIKKLKWKFFFLKHYTNVVSIKKIFPYSEDKNVLLNEHSRAYTTSISIWNLLEGEENEKERNRRLEIANSV